MDLNQYLKSPDAPTLTALSDKVGISKGRLSQLRDSDDWPPKLAMLVEKHTGGMVDAAKISKTVAQARQTA